VLSYLAYPYYNLLIITIDDILNPCIMTDYLIKIGLAPSDYSCLFTPNTQHVKITIWYTFDAVLNIYENSLMFSSTE
jgi:hypothetical protein